MTEQANAVRDRRVMRHFYVASVYVAQWGLLFLAAQGRHWAWNVFAFLMWTCTPLAVIAGVYAQSVKKPLGPRAFGNVLPAVSDIAMALTLAALGHFVYATLAIIQCAFEAAAFKKPEEEAV